MADEYVHIFSVHEPGTHSSEYVHISVDPEHEHLTHDEILAAEQEIQKYVHMSASKTAVVKYFTTSGKASITIFEKRR